MLRGRPRKPFEETAWGKQLAPALDDMARAVKGEGSAADQIRGTREAMAAENQNITGGLRKEMGPYKYMRASNGQTFLVKTDPYGKPIQVIEQVDMGDRGLVNTKQQDFSDMAQRIAARRQSQERQIQSNMKIQHKMIRGNTTYGRSRLLRRNKE